MCVSWSVTLVALAASCLGQSGAILPAPAHTRQDTALYYPDEEHQSYSPTHGYYHHDPHYHDTHYHDTHYHDVGSPHHHHNNDALRALLIPLAGVALLGAAAVFASNPILLQLGVISGSGRRRRDTLAPTDEREYLMAEYLSTSPARCVERLACELNAPADTAHKTERYLMDRIISAIVRNEFVDKRMKNTIVNARRVGQLGGPCEVYSCLALDDDISGEKQKRKQQ